MFLEDEENHASHCSIAADHRMLTFMHLDHWEESDDDPLEPPWSLDRAFWGQPYADCKVEETGFPHPKDKCVDPQPECQAVKKHGRISLLWEHGMEKVCEDSWAADMMEDSDYQWLLKECKVKTNWQLRNFLVS